MAKIGKIARKATAITAAAVSTTSKNEQHGKKNAKNATLSPSNNEKEDVEERDCSIDGRCSKNDERDDNRFLYDDSCADTCPSITVSKRQSSSKISTATNTQLQSNEPSCQYLCGSSNSFDTPLKPVRNDHMTSNDNILTMESGLTFPNYTDLGTSSFEGLSLTDSKIILDPTTMESTDNFGKDGNAISQLNSSNTVDLGDQIGSITMNQDQAWEILNQDSFGFNLGQGTLSLSFSSADENLTLPPHGFINHSSHNGVTMHNALDTDIVEGGDIKTERGKSIDLTRAVSESIDGPSTPSKPKMRSTLPIRSVKGVTDKNSFYSHRGSIRKDSSTPIPHTPPSTHSAPVSSLFLPRKRYFRNDAHQSKYFDHSSTIDCVVNDNYYQEQSFCESKPKSHFSHSPRIERNAHKKQSSPRSKSRRNALQMKSYDYTEELRNESPPPLPNIESEPILRNHDTSVLGPWASPDRKRIKSRNSHRCPPVKESIMGKSRSRENPNSFSGEPSHQTSRHSTSMSTRHSGPPSSSSCHYYSVAPTDRTHPWSSIPIRPNARYPQSPSNAMNGSTSRPSTENSYPTNLSHSHHVSNSQSIALKPSTLQHAMVPTSHPHPAPHHVFPQHNHSQPGYQYHSQVQNHHINSSPLPPHPNTMSTNVVQNSFLPPPLPQFSTNCKGHSSIDSPPREVYIVSSSGAPGASNVQPMEIHPHSTSVSNLTPQPIPSSHRHGTYHHHPYYNQPQHHNHPVLNMPARMPPPNAVPPQATSILGHLSREQAPGIGWPVNEDVLLTECMGHHKTPVDWEVIAKEHGQGRTPRECHDRWTRYLKPGARKGQWREDEDAIVLRVIAQSSEQTFTQWADLVPQLPGRSGKQIRDRWVNYLNPAINHLPFSREDDLRLWEGHSKLGKRWVEISVKVFNSTRSENHIKNRWYSAAFKKFIANEFGSNAYVDTKVGE